MKAGYKQTELGVIPDDWKVVRLDSTVRGIYRGASPRPIENPIWFDDTSSVGWVRISDVTRSGRRLVETTQRLSKKGIQHSRFIPSGSLIMSICATVGRPIETQLDVCIHDGFVVFDRPFTDQSFLYHVLKALAPRWSSKGQTGSQMNLNGSLIKSTLTPIPPTKAEQEAIAEALSDADALIESLDQLIVKKRQLKQGAMQELLTGKRRLPEFGGEWVVKRLGSTATLKARIGWQGLTTAEYQDSGPYHLVTGTEFKDGRIDWDHCHYVDESRYKQDRYIQLQCNDVLVTKDGTIGKIALVKEMPLPATLNSGVFVIRPVSGAFHPEFFYYLLCSNVFTAFLDQLSAGSTINHLYQKDFVSFVYQTPMTVEEQQAIATLLSDMDDELAELETRLAKARQLKQGMMQVLLTGRIRLL